MDYNFCLPQLKLHCFVLACAGPTQFTTNYLPARGVAKHAQGGADPLNTNLGPPPLELLRYLVRIAIAMQTPGHAVPGSTRLATWGVQARLSSMQHCIGQPCPGHEYYKPGMTRGVYAGDNILQWRSHTPHLTLTLPTLINIPHTEPDPLSIGKLLKGNASPTPKLGIRPRLSLPSCGMLISRVAVYG